MTNDMEAGNESFHLLWMNNHLENLRAYFECLYNQQILVDVTIACHDGLLRAHKLILSACSPFLEKIFQENPCKHPTVIMNGVTLNDMQSLCQYMYMGSIKVQESSLSSFLEVARDLQIKGLSEKTVSDDQSKSKPMFNYILNKPECTGDNKFEMMTNDMEAGNESFHLLWMNNHLENLRPHFECLFNQQILVDVTIACHDGLLRAHKLILSACSPFLEKIFQENPCKHPTVIMNGVTLNDMQSLCQYMYMGSVEVQESSLSSFLEVARDLQIKGLSEKTVSDDQSKSKPMFNYILNKPECTGDNKIEMMTNDIDVGNKSFLFRWTNNHLDNLTSHFVCLFNQQILVDVTIGCQDGLLRAHKLILSACSPFLEKIFQENPCEHLTVIMNGVTLNDMQLLCQYMYVGSAEVQESSLSSFLEVSRYLQIKGLSGKTVSDDKLKSKPTFKYIPNKTECTGDNKFEMTNGGSAEAAVDSETTYQVPSENGSSDNNGSFDHASMLIS